MRNSALVACAFALASCAVASPITVTGTGLSLDLAPRAADCAVAFLRTRPPARPYDEVATLYYEGRGGPESAQELMRKKACELGADAVLVSRDYTQLQRSALMTGTAVSFPELRAKHRVDAAVRRAAEAERRKWLDERRAAARKQFPNLPDGWECARVPAETVARQRPGREWMGFIVVPAGADVWISPEATKDHRKVWWQGRVVGWIESQQLEILGPTAAPVPDAAPSSEGPPASKHDI